ncbi:phosphothreonine lyase [Pseudomonas antarctica]|uniref:Phosphothreonine lyase n=2 Tax=Pseudomonas antarctica TaxID=219572 RepID=A0A1H0BL13_9PSED|nr:type III effector [Pseudomonas antarctica]KAF2406523.1 phosphothreonine lyase OspF [Pseudomonas antarctica]SDN46337.1 phosphothreonine lyase [Pseudomonas antarctica]
MRVEISPAPYISSGFKEALLNGRNPFDTGGLENMSHADVAPHANVRFTPNYGAPTFEGVQQSSGEVLGGWRSENKALKFKKFPFIKLTRTPAKEEGKSVGDKFHISVAQQDVPKAFEVISKLIHSKDSPINSWKATDLSRVDPRDTRISQGAQFTLYPKPDRTDGTYSPEYMGKIQALVKTLEQALQEAGIGKSEHTPASDVSAPQWGYVSYRNEVRSDRQGSESQSAALKQEPFFKLSAGIAA